MEPKKKNMRSKKAITPDWDILLWDKLDNLTENEKTNILDSYHFFRGFHDHESAKEKNLSAWDTCVLIKGKMLTRNDFRSEKEFEIAELRRHLSDMKIFLKTFIEKEGVASIDYFCIPEIEEWHVNIYALEDLKKICQNLSKIKAFDGIYTRIKRVLDNLKLSPKTEKKLTQNEIDRIVKEVIKYNTDGKQLIFGPSFNLRLISEIDSLINLLEEGKYLKLSWCLLGFFVRYYNFIYDKYDKELLENRPRARIADSLGRSSPDDTKLWADKLEGKYLEQPKNKCDKAKKTDVLYIIAEEYEKTTGNELKSSGREKLRGWWKKHYPARFLRPSK